MSAQYFVSIWNLTPHLDFYKWFSFIFVLFSTYWEYKSIFYNAFKIESAVSWSMKLGKVIKTILKLFTNFHELLQEVLQNCKMLSEISCHSAVSTSFLSLLIERLQFTIKPESKWEALCTIPNIPMIFKNSIRFTL